MPPRIAIPFPHSEDAEYANRAFPQYAKAVEMAEGEPVRIPLDQPFADVITLIPRFNAVLLLGSKADIDPAKYNVTTAANAARAERGRVSVDVQLEQGPSQNHK